MKPKVARSVPANRGGEVRYERQMLSLIEEMSVSVEHWVGAAYRAAPSPLAQDASPFKGLQQSLRKVAARWIKRFDDAAPKIAEAYLKGSFRATDSAMRQALKNAGWAVEFKMSPAMRQLYEAKLAENIALIKSIPEQYLGQVEGIATRSFTAGRDLYSMVTDLKALYPKAAHRANFIAIDQSNKATAVVTRARQMELGIVEAIWMHSHAGKVPRPDHVAANGKRYKIAEGCLISGKYIYPGEEPGCRCTCRSVLPFSVAP